MPRKLIVAGNWKMNKTNSEARAYFDELNASIPENGPSVLFFIPSLQLSEINNLNLPANVAIGAQNCHFESFGAYTGEISVPMLKAIGIDYVLVGHSERRAYFNETYDLLRLKTDAAIGGGIVPVFCFGESLEVREANKHFDLVKEQLTESLFHLNSVDFSKVILAYEPVWAIGTGATATPDQAQEMHAFVRKTIADKYGEAIADSTTILYGGSVKASNASELFSNVDVDGGLVGGASLKPSDFIPIIEANK